MNRSQRIIELGNLGERAVMKFFDLRGCIVEQSDNPYDQEKDMTVAGKTLEVKTLVPIYKYDSFCLPIKQSRKCEEVDRLIFVRIPDSPDDGLKLYESVPNENGTRYDFREYFNNEYCQFYRLTNLKKLGIVHDKEASHAIWHLSPSTYKGGDNGVSNFARA